MKCLLNAIALIFSSLCFGQAYQISQIPYNPMPFDSGIAVVSVQDDQWGTAQGIGFDFNFFGTPYQALVVGTNCVLSFDLSLQNGVCNWIIDSGYQANPAIPRNSIMFPFHDVDVSQGGAVKHQVYGSLPNRKFVVSFLNVPMYNHPVYQACTGITPFTGQVILYEGTNNIEMHIHNKQACPGWNHGYAIMGLLDSTDTQGYIVPGRNGTVWSATDEAWLFSPDSSSQPAPLNMINGRVFADVNENCLFDNTDYPLGNKPVIFNGSTYTYTDMLGYYSKLVDSGTYNVSTANIANQFYSANCPAGGLYHIVFPGVGDTSNNNVFADTIVQFCSDLAPGILITGDHPYCAPPQTCDTGFVRISCWNKGTLPDSARLILTLNDSTLIMNSPVPYSALGGNRYLFDFGMLAPDEDTVINVKVKFGCDTFGTMYCFDVEIGTTLSLPCLQYVSQRSICTFLGVPYDPNSMHVSSENHPERGEVAYLQTEATDVLNYEVVFQNTGTAVAHNVQLRIGLSPLVDGYTIVPTVASHPYSWVVLNDTLLVDFSGIELPDSSDNLEASMGHFHYRVQPIASISSGNLINHSTEIFFDNNTPIATNIATVEIVDSAITSNPELPAEWNVVLFPNPATDKIQIMSSCDYDDLKVFDVMGRVLVEKHHFAANATIDLRTWTSGVYFVVLRSNDRSKALRFIKN